MLKVVDKYKGQSMTILGIGCLDMDNIGQSMLQVLHSKFPNKFTEDVKPKSKPEKPKLKEGEGDI